MAPANYESDMWQVIVVSTNLETRLRSCLLQLKIRNARNWSLFPTTDDHQICWLYHIQITAFVENEAELFCAIFILKNDLTCKCIIPFVRYISVHKLYWVCAFTLISKPCSLVCHHHSHWLETRSWMNYSSYIGLIFFYQSKKNHIFQTSICY